MIMPAPEITFYRFGEIGIGGQKYNKDVLIFPERVYTNWWREMDHSLSVHDLREVIPSNPEILIIGTGTFSRMKIPAETISFLEAKGIQVIYQSTKNAVQTYNQLCHEKQVVAALHLTC